MRRLFNMYLILRKCCFTATGMDAMRLPELAKDLTIIESEGVRGYRKILRSLRMTASGLIKDCTDSISTRYIVALLIFGSLTFLTACIDSEQQTPEDTDTIIEATEPLADVEGQIKDGKDIASGLIAEGDYLIVKAHCTACHSGKLVTQNRATREGWEEMIRWMQKTQKLWQLGDHEDKILDYLAKHYPPEDVGRRKTLVVDEWYEIEAE